MDGEETTFHSLPNEIILKIFDHASHDGRKKSRLVCHRWCSILDHVQKYFKFCVDLTDESDHLEPFFKSGLTMHVVKLKKFTVVIPNDVDFFPKFKRLILGSDNSAENIAKFLKLCQNLELLVIAHCPFAQISRTSLYKVLQDARFDLTELFLLIDRTKEKEVEGFENHILNCAIFLRAIKMSNLIRVDFIIRDYKTTEQSHEEILALQNLFLGFYEFLANQAKTLKNLKVEVSIDANSYNPILSIPEIPSTTKESICANLKLEICVLGLEGVKQIERLVFPELFGSKLKTLSLDGINNTYYTSAQTTLNSNLAKIFHANAKSLQHVKISQAHVVNFAWFENCSALVKVIIKNSYLDEQGLGSTLSLTTSSQTLRHVDIDHLDNLNLSIFQQCLKLESLKITTKITDRFEHGPPQQYMGILPAMSLKRLELTIHNSNNFCDRQVQQIIDRSGKTLEYLNLFLSGNFTLGNCTALKILELGHKPSNFIGGSSPLNFVHLRELDVRIKPANELLVSWITENMTNLETLEILKKSSVALIQTFLQMPKIKRIALKNNPADDEDIVQFLQLNPELKVHNDTNRYFKRYWILVGNASRVDENLRKLKFSSFHIDSEFK